MVGTTEIKLNELAKLHAGKTAQNVICGLVVPEAKRLHTYENLNYKNRLPYASCDAGRS
jgi:AraC family transcriptional activator of pobA